MLIIQLITLQSSFQDGIKSTFELTFAICTDIHSKTSTCEVKWVYNQQGSCTSSTTSSYIGSRNYMLQKAIDKEYKETNKANIFVWYILFLAFFYFYECPFFFSKKCRNKNSNASKTNQDSSDYNVSSSI